uniref:Low molecular weight glutenin subunit n=1 Tax=Thinopyrum ponticum x Triticum aestivum TaxID=222994 RepID=Q5PU40_9POAL|nr:low molecular weight glutenin subunit [Thinopyrum ponticum x Triticum aestivum]
MKTFLVFALIAVVATSAIAQMETSCIPGLERPWQQQPLPPQQSFSQQPPFSQQQQQPLPQQPSFSQQQPPFSQQQPILSQQPPFSQQQQPVLPQQSPFSQQQQLVLPPQQQQQQLVQQQIPIVQPSVLQQLNPCKVFLQQQCSPVAMPQRLARSQMWQQSSRHVMQQQCCQQLQQIPEQSRYEAIRAIIYSIILQEQQQGFVQPQQQQPQQSGQGVSQSQQQSQQQLGQCSFQQPQQQLGQQPQQQQQQVLQGTFLQPHQIAHLEAVTSIALRTLPTMCSVNVPLYSATTSVPFGVGTGVSAY